MILTLTTDASFSKKALCGTWAVWGACNDGKFSASGKFREEVHSATESEMKAICNGLGLLINHRELNLKVTRIIINTDSLNSIYILQNDKKMKKRYNLNSDRYNAVAKKFQKILGGIKAQKIEFGHVRAHTENNDKRSLANKYCDTMAKEQMAKIVGPIIKK